MKSEEFTLTETGDISFDWAVSSESVSYDYLYYTIYKDGTALSGTGTSTKIGGYTSSDTENNLTYKTITKTLEAGTYTIEFSYRKDGSTNYGLDRGYVKNIVIPGYGENKTMEDSTFIVGQNNKLKQNQYSKTGYTFKGWSTKENSTNIEYQNLNDLSDIETNVKENQNINLYAIWEVNKYTINVVVQNGTVDTSSKQIEYNKNGTFNLTPNIEGTLGTLTCTNGQKGKIESNILTVSNITNNTTCTVTFKDTFTTLYEDGTLIINESVKNRNTNITTHGNITKEYEAMSDSNSYVMKNPWQQPWESEHDSIKSVEIGQRIKPISTAYWFGLLSNMTTGNFANLDTSSVTNMYGMFNSAGENATTWSIGDLSKWDVSSVTNMYGMFNSAGKNATTWNIGDLSGWDTSKVTNMSEMFYFAGYSATTWNIGDLSGWDTSSVTDMSEMFYFPGNSATTWNIGDLSGWDTSKVTNMSYMFISAGSNATTFNLNLSTWNTSKVTDMSYMFTCAGENATTWSIGDLSKWDVSSVTNMNNMFRSAGSNATTWSIGDLSKWDVSSVTNMNNMFRSAGSNATTWNIGDLSNWDTSKVTNMSDMFESAGNKAATFNLNLSGWDTSSVTNMTLMFESAGEGATTWNIGDLSGWDTSKVTNMEFMFQNAGNRATTFSLNLSNWDTSKVRTMYEMFYCAGSNAATFNLDLSNWDTSKVINMSDMFISAGSKATTWTVKIPKTTGSFSNTTSKWYGSSEQDYASPDSGRSFTLAS